MKHTLHAQIATRRGAVQTRAWLTAVKAAVATVALGVAAGVSASDYPQAPVTVLMPWSDGFPANSARIFAEGLSDRFNQSFVVHTRPGAGGEVAAKGVVTAAPDGGTLLVTGSSITIRGVTSEKNADGERDLQPIAQLTTSPYVIVAQPERFKSIHDFLDAAKAAPGDIDFASAGVGTGMHYLGELINVNAGVKMVHIPYASGARQLQAVLAGDVDVAILSLVTALPQIRAGKLDALAVSSTERSKVAPEIPTLVEAGLRDIPSIGAWIAMFGPKGMDPAVVQSLSKQIADVANDPQVTQRVSSWGAEIPDTSVSYLENVIRTEKASWEKLIKEQNLPVAD